MVAQYGTVEKYGNAVADDLASDPITRRGPLAQRDPLMFEGPSSRKSSQVRRAPNASGLYDVLDLILDKGIVIDAFVRVSLVGIELLTVDLRVVIASVDTYLRYAEGVERLDVYNRAGSKRLPDMVGGGMKKGVAAYGAKKVGDALTGDGGDDDEDDGRSNGKNRGIAGALTKGVRNIFSKVTGDDDDDDQREDADDRGEDEDDDRAEATEERPDRGQEDRGRGKQRTMAKAGSRR